MNTDTFRRRSAICNEFYCTRCSCQFKVDLDDVRTRIEHVKKREARYEESLIYTKAVTIPKHNVVVSYVLCENTRCMQEFVLDKSPLKTVKAKKHYAPCSIM